MNDYEKLNRIRKIANEISYQAMDSTYHNDEARLKAVLSSVGRALGMFADLEMQKVKGQEGYIPLAVIEGKLKVALDVMMNPTKDEKPLEKPEPYIIKGELE